MLHYILGEFFCCNDFLIFLFFRSRSSELKRTLPIAKQPFEIPPILLRFLNAGFKEHENMSPTEKKNLEKVRFVIVEFYCAYVRD